MKVLMAMLGIIAGAGYGAGLIGAWVFSTAPLAVLIIGCFFAGVILPASILWLPKAAREEELEL
jgi:hypothetical protein